MTKRRVYRCDRCGRPMLHIPAEDYPDGGVQCPACEDLHDRPTQRHGEGSNG